MKKINKIIAFSAATFFITSSTLQVLAYDTDDAGNSIESVEYQESTDSDFENSTNVYAEIASEYKVTIPKVVVLSGTSKAAKYIVKVQGDIAGYEQVKVEPDNSLTLTAPNKNDVTASIDQDKTTWQYSNFDEYRCAHS